jgi:hypothetical protein
MTASVVDMATMDEYFFDREGDTIVIKVNGTEFRMPWEIARSLAFMTIAATKDDKEAEKKSRRGRKG